MILTKRFAFVLFGLLISFMALSQDTLPNFSVRNLGNNKIVIGWVNQFPNVAQISIQRSFDSLRNYKTILSVADPKAIQNGFADTKAPNDHMYYRIFYAMQGGSFYFTASRRPFFDSAAAVSEVKTQPVIQRRPDGFVPSFYVYTNRDGYVHISLPDAARKKYSIKFYEENGSFLFDLKSVKEPSLTLDKANFYHAGWFTFELYDDEKLIEKHKFYLAKDF